MNTGHGARAWAGAGLAAGHHLHVQRVNRPVDAIDLEVHSFFSEIPPDVVDEEGKPVVISEGAPSLPKVNGSEMVRNLRAAMNLGGDPGR